MNEIIFFTDNSWTGLILRLTLGIIMFPHGAQKMFGLFGGYGFEPTMFFLRNEMKLPWLIAFLVIAIEFFCSMSLIIGFNVRLCAVLFIVIMTGAILTVNLVYGFFMNWFGNQKGEGYEYHLLIIGISIALLFTGGGKYSIDGFINSFSY